MSIGLRNRSGFAAAIASLACAAALQMGTQPAAAHDGAHAARKPESAAAPAAPAYRNRWGANYFPNVELTTQHGTKVRLYDDLLKGKSVAFNVLFTECEDVCPLETAMLVQLQKTLGDRVGKDIFFYSVSIDPERDTPEVLKAYADKFGAGGPGWLFLTGKPEDIKLVTRKLGLLRASEADKRDNHSAVLVLGDVPNGQWTRRHALDNPQFLAAMMGTFFGWRETQPAQSYAAARPLEYDTGQYLFQSRCSACHSIGEGDKVGPDLADVTRRRESAWLSRYIRTPDQVLAAGDPIATALFKKYQVRMPNLELTAEEVAGVLAYLEARSKTLREKAGKESTSRAAR